MEGVWILAQDEELAGTDGNAGWKDEFRATGQAPAGHVHRLGTIVVEFDELDPFLVHVRGGVDLVDDHGSVQEPGRQGREHRKAG